MAEVRFFTVRINGFVYAVDVKPIKADNAFHDLTVVASDPKTFPGP